MFQVGIIVFTLASLLDGLAPSEGLLIGARVLQGIGAAPVCSKPRSEVATRIAGRPQVPAA